MRDIHKPAQDLRRIAELVGLPNPETRIGNARRFMREVMNEHGHFTRYSIITTYGDVGQMDALRLELYFLDGSSDGFRRQEASSYIEIYRRV